MPNRKRTTLALATALAGSIVVTGAPAAYAEVVDVNYQCVTPIGPKGAVSPIDIKSVRSGDGYKLTMSFQKGVSSSPVELGKGAMNPSAVIELGGAETGRSRSPARRTKRRFRPTPRSGSATCRGRTPEEERQGHLHRRGPHHQGPRYDDDLHTQEQPGPLPRTGRPGGGRFIGRSDRPGSDRRLQPAVPRGTSGGGELPRTGPLDSAAALGTLGGTVLLTGAAGVLWLTRRGQRPTG